MGTHLNQLEVVMKKSLTAYFDGLVLPHLNYADIVRGNQSGLMTWMKQLQSFKIALQKGF